MLQDLLDSDPGLTQGFKRARFLVMDEADRWVGAQGQAMPLTGTWTPNLDTGQEFFEVPPPPCHFLRQPESAQAPAPPSACPACGQHPPPPASPPPRLRRLLDPSFEPALRSVLRALPPAAQRQTLLFSATMTPSLVGLQQAMLEDAFVFQVCARGRGGGTEKGGEG